MKLLVFTHKEILFRYLSNQWTIHSQKFSEIDYTSNFALISETP